jgi:hypothetical protein
MKNLSHLASEELMRARSRIIFQVQRCHWLNDRIGEKGAITAMQVPGYGHLHVDDESGGSGNPYDVRPQPKESERAEKSTKKCRRHLQHPREPEMQRAEEMRALKDCGR